MAILAMALLQQHDARRDILIEPAARRRAAIEAWGHSKMGAQSGRKNQRACLVFFWLLEFNCQYQCNSLPGKTHPVNDLLCCKWNFKQCSLTRSLMICLTAKENSGFL